MMSPKETELLGATALLGGGISLPLQTLLGTVRITMRIPSTEDLLRISRMYLKMGVTAEELNGYTFEQKARFMVIHGREVSRMVAFGIARRWPPPGVKNRIVAWLLRRYMHPVALQEAWMRILSPLTLGAFGNITASAEAVNQMAPLTMGQ
ncbi:hypothetical protein [Phocaeicola massiliensis]|jgi:hypothetical protein|nr:hypothetical protein [Phocaeicola massiliensis]